MRDVMRVGSVWCLPPNDQYLRCSRVSNEKTRVFRPGYLNARFGEERAEFGWCRVANSIMAEEILFQVFRGRIAFEEQVHRFHWDFKAVEVTRSGKWVTPEIGAEWVVGAIVHVIFGKNDSRPLLESAF